MKKTLLTSLLSLAAAGAFAQGTVIFNGRSVGTIVTHIYSPQLSGPAVSGNAANDTPAGGAVYSGQLLGGLGTGATSSSDYSNGNLWTVQLYAAPGTGDSASSLLPVSQYVTTMRTTGTASAGFFNPVSPAVDNGIPNTPANAPSATLALAAWYNGGGTITSLAQAIAAGVPEGESPTFNINQLGEAASAGPPPTTAQAAPFLTGLQSFSLNPSATPEPSTIALGVMGISAFLIRRRK
jgi:hypothetical protein